ncbi:MAG: Asp-tRNA(Asn)/Glu-tRNA(Gln) amidotransferase subunit GatC [Alphaproteobacteria bacterium]|nr:Asp-tRNA(Asn)/Glu-tRNA(Gln) amidotransferase subunit GatC [Alphaproteobacteria bacterium]
MSFSKASLKKFAELSRIALTEEELEKLNMDDLEAIAKSINKIDTANVKPMISPAVIPQRFREDTVTEGDCLEALMSNAPDVGNNAYFAVPKMIEEE